MTLIHSQMEGVEFSEIALMKKYKINPYFHGEHEMGKKPHSTEAYQFPLGPGIIAYWSICPKCTQVRTKKVIAYENDGEGYAIAYVKDIIKDGVYQ